MLRIQGTGRIQPMAGRKKDGSVEKVEDLLCPRKHMIDDKGWKYIRSADKIFAFVSSPKIYRQKEMLKRVQAWCHPFRNPDKISSNAPKLLLPESDFLDSSIVKCKNERRYVYDYFYFTVNAAAGIENKGLYTFIDILPTLCYYNLKGRIIVYYPNTGRPPNWRVSLSKQQRKILRNYDKYLNYSWGLLRDSQIDECMRSCRFGLFPNTVDNSPRMITESLSRDVPILMNEDIDGGWHYINEKTGCLFNKKTIAQSIEFMLSNKFDVKRNYESQFGFEKSSRKLAEFLNPIFGYDYTHMFFYAFKKNLKSIE